MRTIKLVMVGDGAVGKTCFLIRYATNAFPGEYIPTVFDNYNANVMFEGEHVNLGLWDIGGGEDYDRLRPLSYPETDIFFVNFSMASQTSLENTQSKWVPEITHHCPETPFLLVGLKSDLAGQDELEETQFMGVNSIEANNMAVTLKAAGYVECSALTGEGVRNAIQLALRVVFYGKGNLKKKKKMDWGFQEFLC